MHSSLYHNLPIVPVGVHSWNYSMTKYTDYFEPIYMSITCKDDRIQGYRGFILVFSLFLKQNEKHCLNQFASSHDLYQLMRMITSLPGEQPFEVNTDFLSCGEINISLVCSLSRDLELWGY